MPVIFLCVFIALSGTGSLLRSPAAAQHHLRFPGRTCPLAAPNKHGLFSHALFSVGKWRYPCKHCWVQPCVVLQLVSPMSLFTIAGTGLRCDVWLVQCVWPIRGQLRLAIYRSLTWPSNTTCHLIPLPCVCHVTLGHISLSVCPTCFFSACWF